MAEGSGREHPVALEGVGGWTCRRPVEFRRNSELFATMHGAGEIYRLGRAPGATHE